MSEVWNIAWACSRCIVSKTLELARRTLQMLYVGVARPSVAKLRWCPQPIGVTEHKAIPKAVCPYLSGAIPGAGHGWEAAEDDVKVSWSEAGGDALTADGLNYPALRVSVATVTCGQRTLLKIRITTWEYCNCRYVGSPKYGSISRHLSSRWSPSSG